MKIIKRSGAEASFDLSKIIIAIQKANKSVKQGDRMPESDILEIANKVEQDCLALKRSPSVRSEERRVGKEC